MNNQELKAQFKRCQVWNDPEQWDLLGLAYYQRGYVLNALRCFKLADACRPHAVTVETGIEVVA
jgi:cytochrome c-type biogenesis protein CcmH/NrfG